MNAEQHMEYIFAHGHHLYQPNDDIAYEYQPLVEENVFPVNKNVPQDVLDKLNSVITEMLEDGSLAALSEKWFERDITVPFSEATEEVAGQNSSSSSN